MNWISCCSIWVDEDDDSCGVVDTIIIVVASFIVLVIILAIVDQYSFVLIQLKLIEFDQFIQIDAT